jgi:hypothetical protein
MFPIGKFARLPMADIMADLVYNRDLGSLGHDWDAGRGCASLVSLGCVICF